MRKSVCIIDFQINVGDSHRVQYGQISKQASLATILASGTDSQMREEKAKRENNSNKQEASTTKKAPVKRRKKQAVESSKENSPQLPVKVQYAII